MTKKDEAEDVIGELLDLPLCRNCHRNRISKEDADFLKLKFTTMLLGGDYMRLLCTVCKGFGETYDNIVFKGQSTHDP